MPILREWSRLGRRLVALGVAPLAIACLGACSRAPAPPSNRPNVLLISIDSLRADHVGAYGYEPATTPTIDRLARDGVRFANAVSTTSWTLPAHAALLTGVHDAEHGATVPKSRLDRSIPSLARALDAAGYRTVGLYSGPFLDPMFGLHSGFERYVECTSYADERDRGIGKTHAASHKDVTNPILAEAFARVVAERDPRPSFFFVHMWDVHYDLLPPPPYDRMFDAAYAGDFAGYRYRRERGFRPGMAEADYRHVIALYDGEIRFTDDTLGGMLDELARTGLLENTLVVVTSDHGDEFLEHGGKGHRRTLFQEVLAVPLVFWAPALLEPAVASVSASLVDVAPSILSLLGLPPLDGASGRTLFDATRRPLLDGRVAIAELRLNPRRPLLTAAYEHPHKVIVDARRGTASYYDLVADPGELAPRDASAADAGRRLVETLDRFYASAANRARSIARDKKLPAAMEKRLRALGYLD